MLVNPGSDHANMLNSNMLSQENTYNLALGAVFDPKNNV